MKVEIDGDLCRPHNGLAKENIEAVDVDQHRLRALALGLQALIEGASIQYCKIAGNEDVFGPVADALDAEPWCFELAPFMGAGDVNRCQTIMKFLASDGL